MTLVSDYPTWYCNDEDSSGGGADGDDDDFAYDERTIPRRRTDECCHSGQYKTRNWWTWPKLILAEVVRRLTAGLKVQQHFRNNHLKRLPCCYYYSHSYSAFEWAKQYNSRVEGYTVRCQRIHLP